MLFSATPFLAILQLLIFWFWGNKVLAQDKAIKRYTLYTLLVVFCAWLAYSSKMSIEDKYYTNTYYLSTFIGLLIPLFIIRFFYIFYDFKKFFFALAFVIPTTWQLLFQGLRVVSFGGFILYFKGFLPLYFILAAVVPDFIYSMISLGLFFYYRKRPLSKILTFYHLLGILVFVIGGITIYLGVPSYLRVTDSLPDTKILFFFPFSLEQTFTIPVFILGNLLGLYSLRVRLKG